MFEPRIYKERRRRLLRAAGPGLGLFLGNEESPMNYPENTFRFRQDSTFLYYFGLDRPGLAAVMDFDEGTATVYGDDYTVDDIVWRGPQPAIREMSRRAGVDRTGTADELAGRLKDARRAGRRIHFLPPYRAENALKLKRWLGLNPDRAAAAASVDLIRAVVEQRAVKGPEEIAEPDRAADISTDMHVAAMRVGRPGVAARESAAEVPRAALAARWSVRHGRASLPGWRPSPLIALTWWIGLTVVGLVRTFGG
mgnify:CR=1 FL=1